MGFFDTVASIGASIGGTVADVASLGGQVLDTAAGVFSVGGQLGLFDPADVFGGSASSQLPSFIPPFQPGPVVIQQPPPLDVVDVPQTMPAGQMPSSEPTAAERHGGLVDSLIPSDSGGLLILGLVLVVVFAPRGG